MFTIEHLAKIMLEGAGETEPIDWTGDILGTPFDELGYDSIALLETASRVRQEFGVRMEDELGEVRTPGEFIDQVNWLAAAK